MSVSVANKILKDHGLGFVKINTPNGEKCITPGGKRVKGIYGSNTGPLTVTDSPYEKLNNILSSLKDSLSLEFLYDETYNAFVISSNSKSKTMLSLITQDFPTYTMDMGYDTMYRTHYIVPHFFKVQSK